MLPAHNRMRESGDFRATIKTGVRGKSSSLMLHLASPDDAVIADRAPALVGFVVPKTVGNAVIRNRVKRQLRHIVRDKLDAIPAGTQIVVRVFPQARGKTAERLRDDFDYAFSKASRVQP